MSPKTLQDFNADGIPLSDTGSNVVSKGRGRSLDSLDTDIVEIASLLPGRDTPNSLPPLYSYRQRQLALHKQVTLDRYFENYSNIIITSNHMRQSQRYRLHLLGGLLIGTVVKIFELLIQSLFTAHTN